MPMKEFVNMIAFLIDADNLSGPEWIDEAFANIEAVHGALSVRRAYGSATHLKALADVMRSRAIRPFVNLSLTKNTTDVALAVDAMELACQTPRVTTVIIGSGDADFLPLVVRLRERGIRMICVSDRSKMAPEAVAAYDEIVYVGAAQSVSASQISAVVLAPPKAVPSSSLTKKAAEKKAETKKVAAKSATIKTSSGKKPAPTKMAVTPAKITLRQILEAAPTLKSGQSQHLSEIVKLLHDGKLLGKNAPSTKLFKTFPKNFELTPAKQPNQVRYLANSGKSQ